MTSDSLVAALEKVSLKRLCLIPGVVGSYNGAYDWVRKDSTDPDEAPGEHPGSDLCDAYLIVQVADLDALAAAAREWIKEQLTNLDNTVCPGGADWVGSEEGAYADVARRLGL